MQTNVGTTDRIIRAIAGIAALIGALVLGIGTVGGILLLVVGSMLTGDGRDAAGLVQDTQLRGLQGAGRFDGRSSLTTWVAAADAQPGGRNRTSLPRGPH